MTQKELTTQLATELEIPHAQAARLLKATTEELRSSLKDGQAVSIPDWGTFDTSIHEPHRGFLPHIRRFAMLPKRRVPVFRPSEEMREDLHDLEEENAGSWR